MSINVPSQTGRSGPEVSRRSVLLEARRSLPQPP